MKKYKLAYINNEEIILTNKPMSVSNLYYDIIEDPIVSNNNNVVEIKGNKRDYDFYNYAGDVDISLVDKSYIKQKRKVFSKEYKKYVKSGWVLMKKRIKFHKYFSHFTLEIKEE